MQSTKLNPKICWTGTWREIMASQCLLYIFRPHGNFCADMSSSWCECVHAAGAKSMQTRPGAVACTHGLHLSRDDRESFSDFVRQDEGHVVMSYSSAAIMHRTTCARTGTNRFLSSCVHVPRWIGRIGKSTPPILVKVRVQKGSRRGNPTDGGEYWGSP